MRLTHKCAQNIVDRTMKVLKYNINIMDHMGVIVGSGDKKRLDTFHQGAAEVIQAGKAMEITVEQARGLEGARPGVNLPVYLNEKIVGAVGITGDPDEVRPFGELLKISVENMLQQVFLTEQLRMEQNARELYIRDILGGNFNNDEGLFLIKGSVLGFDMTIPRVALVIKIYGLNEKDLIKENELTDGIENRRISLRLQKRRENILNLIKNVFYNPQNIISHDGSSNFIIFYVTKKTLPKEIASEITEQIENIQSKLAKHNISCLAGVGLLHAGISGLKKSYDEAMQVIYISEKIENYGGRFKNIVTALDLGLEIALSNRSKDALRDYLDLFLHDKKSGGRILNHLKLIETLKIFFRCDLNQTIAAQRLNVSRNTLTNRLNRVQDMTGHDPRNFSDAVKLKLFLLIDELQK